MDIKNIEPKNRKYMREYKRRQYAEKGDLIRAKNKAYYYKTKFGLNTEEKKIDFRRCVQKFPKIK